MTNLLARWAGGQLKESVLNNILGSEERKFQNMGMVVNLFQFPDGESQFRKQQEHAGMFGDFIKRYPRQARRLREIVNSLADPKEALCKAADLIKHELERKGSQWKEIKAAESLEKGCRFPGSVFEAIKREVPPDFPDWQNSNAPYDQPAFWTRIVLIAFLDRFLSKT